MLRIFTMIASLGVVCAVSCASTLQGDFKWAEGVLAKSVIIRSSPVSVELSNGSTTTTYDNVFVTGMPGYTIESGSQFYILLNGSNVFRATMTKPGNEFFSTPRDGSGVAGNRVVSVSAGGVLSQSVGFAINNTTVLQVLVPSCSVDAYNFKNGVVMRMGQPLAGFSLTLPEQNSPTVSLVNFPTGIPYPTDFEFHAKGTGSLDFFGTSVNFTDYVSGVAEGRGTDYTVANMDIAVPRLP